jgi:hypothetical protein
LLRSLSRKSPPALYSLSRRDDQVSIGTLCTKRQNPRNTELRGFLNGPLHSIKLENGENNRHVGERHCPDLIPKFKFDSRLLDRCDSATPD